MDELREFCRRVLGPGVAAEEVWRSVPANGGGRTERLMALIRACRTRAGEAGAAAPGTAGPEGATGLADAVAGEMSAATAKLPERQREALALRELMRLSYAQIAQVVGIDASAVPLLLARARLRLRSERRGATEAAHAGRCPDRDRALRGLVRRLDSEPISGADDDWLCTHLRECDECSQAHAALLEASACYRAWPTGAALPGSDATDTGMAGSARTVAAG